MHDILTADHFSPSNRKISVTLANYFAARVVTVSIAGEKSFIDSGGRAKLSCVVYNGISASDPLSVSDSLPLRTKLREEFGIGNVRLVGVFGRLTAWKGQHVLIRALPALPGIHAIFVGEALFNENEYADSLRTLAADLGVVDRVHFAGFRSDIAAAMSEVDVVAHTSTSPEPFGRVLVEAMLARRPLIASAAGGAAEIVTDRVDGLLIEPGNPAKLAEAILEVFGNPGAMQKRVEEGYQTAVTKFSLDNFLAGIDAVVADLVSVKGCETPMMSASYRGST